MNRLLLVALFLSLLVFPSFAQITYTLSGVVRDSATNRPLSRAAVVLNYEKATRSPVRGFCLEMVLREKFWLVTVEIDSDGGQQGGV